ESLSAQESLKRFLRKEQNMAEERLQTQLDKRFAELRGEMYELEALQEEQNAGGWRTFVIGMLGGVVALAGITLGYFAMDGSESIAMGKAQSEQEGELMAMLSDQNEQIELLTQQLNATAENQAGEIETALPLKLIEWAANQSTEFSYGEQPFNDEKALWLSELVAQLKDSGFRGTIELRANHGNFCLQKGVSGGLKLAEKDMDINNCQFAVDHRGSNDWLNDQSVAFANYINVELARSGGELEIILFSNGFDEPLMPYPSLYEVNNAGDWNVVAAQNQRVQVNLYSN
ncbi:MAG: hypothetical protein ABW100_01620, partial [Candidatus Thiodiazotropha sp. 6PLUC3]